MKNIIDKVQIKELNNIDEMLFAYPLLNKMFPNMDNEEFLTSTDEMIQNNNYKMVAAVIDDKIIAICGYWVLKMFYCGRYMQLTNLMVEKEYRSLGIGNKILNYLEQKARSLGCVNIVLESYTENKKSHSLYFKNDYYIRGFHFMKDL